MEYYSTIKRSEVLIPAPVWMNLKNWKNPDPKGCIFYDSINRNYSRIAKSIKTQTDQ